LVAYLNDRQLIVVMRTHVADYGALRCPRPQKRRPLLQKSPRLPQKRPLPPADLEKPWLQQRNLTKKPNLRC